MDKKIKVFSVLFTICASVGIYIVGYFVATTLVATVPVLREFHTMYINALAMTVATLAVLVTIRKEEYGFRIEHKPALTIPMILLLAYSSSVLFNVLLGSIPWRDFFASDVTPDETVFFGIPLWARMICYEVVAPISEELLFRQVIFKRLKGIAPVWVAVIVSALLFGIYHGNLVQGIYAFIMGILLALVYEWTGSFIAPVIFHVVANHVSDIAYEFETVGSVLYSSTGAIVSAIVFMVTIMILYKNKNKCSKNGLHCD